MYLAIFGQLTQNTQVKKIIEFLLFLKKAKVRFCIYASYWEQLQKAAKLKENTSLEWEVFSYFEEIKDADYIFSIGGDGTFLKTTRVASEYDIPIVGINVGRLGFLASFSQEQLIKITQAVLKGQIYIEKRTMITLRSSHPHIFEEYNTALNEITIHKTHSNEMIVIHTYVNGEYLNSYWADGLIISTPTGSTAYSLSCGGPIIMPTTNVFLLIPIAPHSLTVRPLVLPDDVLITFEIETRSGKALVALDNITKLVPNEIELAAHKAKKKVSFVKTPFVPTFIETLRKRLHWGKDVRNRS